MHNFTFIPSVSAGYLYGGILADRQFKNGLSYDYYNYQGKFSNPYFLITAGHFYKKDQYEVGKFFNNNNVEIFGDSGGFQIKTGNLKWADDLPLKILQWLERNSTIAANLDIPPGSAGFSNTEVRDMSYQNFKLFHEKQSGKTKFLNVLQGSDYNTYNSWYKFVSEFTDFYGWCIGNRSSILNIITSYYVLLRNKEHLRSGVFHFLGVSSPLSFLIMAHMQNELNNLGLNIKIYSDSSSPNLARFGTYYTGINLNSLAWKSIHVPYLRKEKENLSALNLEIYNNPYKFPLLTQFDKEVFLDLFDPKDLYDHNERFGSALILRNIYVYKEVADELSELSKLPFYYRKDVFNEEIATLGEVVIKMTRCHDSVIELDKIYNTYLPLIASYSASDLKSASNHNFF
jgi:hypothetical protein